MKNCRGPLVAENFLYTHENLAKWLIRKGAEGYRIEDLLPVLAKQSMDSTRIMSVKVTSVAILPSSACVLAVRC